MRCFQLQQQQVKRQVQLEEESIRISHATAVRENIFKLLKEKNIDMKSNGLDELLDDKFWFEPEIPTSEAVAPPLKKRRKNKNTKSTKTIVGMDKYKAFKTSHEKLTFISEVYDENTSDYIDKDRMWLRRMNPIALCWKRCCATNIELFLEKHGIEKPNHPDYFSPYSFIVCGTKCGKLHQTS